MSDKNKEMTCDLCLWLQHYREYCSKKDISVPKYSPACQYFLKSDRC